MIKATDENRWSVLMVSAQAGNETDYRQLLQELALVIHNFLCRRFGRSHFIEDCVQECLIAVHQARHTYDPKRPFRPWLFAIVRHKAIDTLRRQRTRDRVTEDYRTEMEIRSQRDHQDVSTTGVAAGSLLERLPNPYREVLILTKIIGFSIAETASRLEISETAAKVRVHRAVHKLRRLLEKDDDFN